MAYKIMLDPGHGGSDPGAVSGSHREKDYTLAMALAVGKRLTELGATVGYSRTADVYVDVAARGKAAKGYDYMLSIHLNAGGGKGAEVISQARQTNATMDVLLMQYLSKLNGVRNYKTRRRDTGAFLTRTLKGKTFKSLPYDTYYGVLYHAERAKVKANLLEMCFIDAPADMAIYTAKQVEYCEAIVRAICEGCGIAYKAPATTKPADTGKLYRVQVGAFAQKANAEKLAAELASKGYKTYIVN